MLSWSFIPDNWSFDVASLMVLVGEADERSYRLSERSLLEALTAAPVIGLQNYIGSYSFLLDDGSYSYYSPVGCKTAPLRNARLDKIIGLQNLLRDGRYTVYQITDSPPETRFKVQLYIFLWVVFTWVCLGGILLFLFLVGDTTWIGLANCIALSGWSIIIRTAEHFLIKPARVISEPVSNKGDDDAVFIMGRNSSAFVLVGKRIVIKHWTTRGLTYHDFVKDPSSTDGDGPSSPSDQENNTEEAESQNEKKSKLPTWAEMCQYLTRSVTFLVLVFVFITIPNGTTMDQTAFVLLNVLGQVNALVGRALNAWDLLDYLEEKETRRNVSSRTYIYALLLRKFHSFSGCPEDWPEATSLLPQTTVWKKWQECVIQEPTRDAKKLYDEIDKEERDKIQQERGEDQGGRRAAAFVGGLK